MDDRLVFQFSTPAHSTLRQRWENRWSSLIRLACHSPFSHVDTVLPDGSLLGASDSPDAKICLSTPAGNPRGMAIRPHDYPKEWGYRRRMVIRTPLAQRILAREMTQLGKPFDNGAIKDFISVRFPGHRDWRDTGQWFCAEEKVWAIEQEGYWPWEAIPWPKNRVSPTDLLMMFVTDPKWQNPDTFWDPVAGLVLGRYET